MAAPSRAATEIGLAPATLLRRRLAADDVAARGLAPFGFEDLA